VLAYVIRHGQTDWNVDERLQGSKDIPLNETGRRQARGNGDMLGDILGETVAEFDYVASPLWRTRETMELVRQQMALSPEGYRTDERLIELSFGDWEGLTLGEIATKEASLVAARERNKWAFLPPGESAESYEILSRRIAGWLASIERQTVCVCHGGVIRCLFKLVGGLSGHDAALLDVPQDRILKIDDGGIRWL